MKLPKHIQENLKRDKHYYDMTGPNIERCKVDPDYLGEAILVNENLIWYSVHKYIGNPDTIVKNNCIEKDDILQLGRMGFIKAIKAFDTKRGIKFSSFAVTAIVREIRCFLRDSGSIIRPTRTANELINKIRKIENEFGYLPSVEELEDLLGENREKINKALQVGRTVKYLDEEVAAGGEQSSLTLLDLIDSNSDLEDDILDKVYVDSVLDKLSDKLTEKEMNVLRLRLAGYSQTQTAAKEHISQMRVSRIMKKVALLIKEHPDLKNLLSSA